MCGLIGFSGKSHFYKNDILTLITWNSLERGEDSTGLYTPSHGVYKTLDRGSDFVVSAKRDNLIEDNLFIGHVRAATVGAKNIDNSHPFDVGNYVLAHNGTLKNHVDLAKKYNIDLNTHTVDSHILAACIEKENNIATVVQQIEGAAALLIYDKREPNTLYVFRKGDNNVNNQRPLYRGTDEEGNMYISSIDNPLYFIGVNSIKSFKEDVLYKIVNGKIVENKRIKNIPYKHPWSNNINNNNQIKESSLSFRNSMLVCKHTITFKELSKKYNYPLHFERNEEYFCLNEDPTNKDYVIIKICIGVNQFAFPVISKRVFNLDYVISVGDYVETVTDICLTNSTEIVSRKGEVFKITMLHSDGDVSVKRLDHCGGGSPFSFTKKIFVRKLIGSKLEEALKAEKDFHAKSIETININENEEIVENNDKKPITCDLPVVISNRNPKQQQLNLLGDFMIKNQGASFPSIDLTGDNVDDENESDTESPIDNYVKQFKDFLTELNDLSEEILDRNYHLENDQKLNALIYKLQNKIEEGVNKFLEDEQDA